MVVVALIKITKSNNNVGTLYCLLTILDDFIYLKFALHEKSDKRYLLPQVAFSSIILVEL